MTGRLPFCTACTGWPSTWLPIGRCCSRLTMRIGRTSRRCGGWPIWRRGSRVWRSHWWLRFDRASRVDGSVRCWRCARRASVVRPRLLSERRGRRGRSRRGRRRRERRVVRGGVGGKRRQSVLRDRAAAGGRARRAVVGPGSIRPRRWPAGVEAIAPRVVARVRRRSARAGARTGARRARRRLRAAAGGGDRRRGDARGRAAGGWSGSSRDPGDRRPAGLPPSGHPRRAGGVAGQRRARCGSSSCRADCFTPTVPRPGRWLRISSRAAGG